MLETAHIAYTTTVEMSSSDDVDELYCLNLCSCIKSSNLKYKEPITGDMQHTGVAGTGGPYSERLESI